MESGKYILWSSKGIKNFKFWKFLDKISNKEKYCFKQKKCYFQIVSLHLSFCLFPLLENGFGWLGKLYLFIL